MTSPIDIANRSIAMVKSGVTISSFDESSREARLCGQFFESTRNSVLSSPLVDWGFARTFVAPAQLAHGGILNWIHAYRYPSDCLCLRQVIGPPMVRPDRHGHPFVPVRDLENGLPHQIARDGQGRMILTNEPVRWLQYTAIVEDPNQWSSPFQDAVAAYLASQIAIPLGGSAQLAQSCLQAYEAALVVAVNHSSAEDFQPPEAPVPDFVLARR